MSVKSNIGVVTDGLVFYVDAGNDLSYLGSGGTWSDLVGGHNGSFNNMDDINNPSNNYDSANGGSLVFDNTDDIVVHGSSNNLTGDNLQTCTLSAWFKTTTTGLAYIASIKRSSTDSSLITLTVNTIASGQIDNGRAGFLTRNFADTLHTSITDNNSGNGYNDNNWHYVAAVVNGTTRTLYIDGSQKATDTDGMQSVTGNTAAFTIGGFAASGFPSQFYGGNIANVSFYNRALTSTEITQNYNALKNRFI